MALRAAIPLGHTGLLRMSPSQARELFETVESDLPTPRQRQRRSATDDVLKVAE
jgi:hypothetical protein